MYALVTVIHHYYSEKVSVSVELFNTLKRAQDFARIITEKSPEVIKGHNNTTWQYPSSTNGVENFDIYITDDIQQPCDKEVQLSMFD